jgi:hypothetical protein
MKTKEEILNKHDTSRKCIEQTCRPELFAAMDEYAKQQAIDFANYLQFNYQPHAEQGYWFNHHNDPHGKTILATGDVFQLFFRRQITAFTLKIIHLCREFKEFAAFVFLYTQVVRSGR